MTVRKIKRKREGERNGQDRFINEKRVKINTIKNTFVKRLAEIFFSPK